MAQIKRQLCAWICLILWLICAASGAEGTNAARISVEKINWTWESAEAATFRMEILAGEADLSGGKIQLRAETVPEMEDPGTVKITTVDGKRLKVKKQGVSYDIPQGEPIHTLTIEGYWEPPVPRGVIRRLTIHAVVTGVSGEMLGSLDWVVRYDPLENSMPGFLEYTLQTIPFCLGLILITVLLWLFCRRRGRPLSPAAERRLDRLIIILFFLGVFIIPIHLRGPFFSQYIHSLSYINFLFVLAVILSFLKIRRWGKVEIILYSAWVLSFIPMGYSNLVINEWRRITAVFQNLVPLIIVFYRMGEDGKEKSIRLLLILFDAFTVLLLILCIEEKITGKYPFQMLINWMEEAGYYTREYVLYYHDPRSGYIWGHPLTNALIFNTFFVVNAAYIRVYRKKNLTPVVFLITLGGVLLASSKTGIVVCFLLLIISFWKYKKWLLALIPVLVIMYFLGAFDGIIRRFTTSTLTTGRLEGLTGYIQAQENPMHLLFGHGSNDILLETNMSYRYRAGFEFPLLMFAFDYGYLFSALSMIGVYAYSSWRLLRRKNWFIWLGYSLLFAEINTYNGYALRNQDVFVFACFMTMILLNLGEASPEGQLAGQPDDAGGQTKTRPAGKRRRRSEKYEKAQPDDA